MYCVLWFATHLTKPLIVSSWSEGDSGFPRQVAAFMVTKNDLSVLLALHDETVQWLPKGLWASVLSCVQLIVLSDSKWKHGRPVYQVYNWPHVTRDCWGIWRVPQRHPLPHSPAAGASASFNSLLWVSKMKIPDRGFMRIKRHNRCKIPRRELQYRWISF